MAVTNRRTIFWLWLPLALSFTLMMLEGPTVQSAIARLGDPALNLAAFGLAFGIGLIIESPVIMFVSTAIALVADAQSYYALRRFMIVTILGLTLLTAVIAWTPLYDLIATSILGIPQPIVAAGRPAMQIMLLWSAAIGWRRFYQGILVRYGQSRRVTYGTTLRLTTNLVSAAALTAWGGLSGASVGALVLMAGVLVEGVATYLMALPIVRDRVLTQPTTGRPPLTMGQIMTFHMPLAATSLLTFLVQPATSAALARLALPRESLAAWPVIFSIMLVLRGWGLALQETTIAEAHNPQALRPLRDFTLIVAGTTTLVALLLSLTPLMDIYLRSVIGLETELEPFVRIGVQVALLVPALTALTSWLRGLMVAANTTSVVRGGMIINLAVNCLALAVGVALGLPGIPVAAFALTLAMVGEFVYLLRRRTSNDQRPTTNDQRRRTTDDRPLTTEERRPLVDSFSSTQMEGHSDV